LQNVIIEEKKHILKDTIFQNSIFFKKNCLHSQLSHNKPFLHIHIIITEFKWLVEAAGVRVAQSLVFLCRVL
jgi:hypothetical protein